MNPYLWGPALWQALFACAWNANNDQGVLLHRLLAELLPLLIPCEKCRAHFHKKQPIVLKNMAKATKMTTPPRPDAPERAFRWLWHLKDQVNQTLGTRSISMDDLTQRFLLHGPVVDDVVLGDTLVLIALDAHERKLDDHFVEFCTILGTLLPLPSDSELLRALQAKVFRRPILPSSVRAAKGARIERGLVPHELKHYKYISEE